LRTGNKHASFISASVVPAACILGVTYAECNHTAVIAAMFIAVTAMGGMFSGVYSNNLDIAPNYAGIDHA
jgi:ACS family sodium-dependent inorganic phosphate cotransporter